MITWGVDGGNRFEYRPWVVHQKELQLTFTRGNRVPWDRKQTTKDLLAG